MSKFVLLVETGSDIPAEMAQRYGIYTVPMHVAFGEDSRDDGTFPAEDIYRYFEKTGKLTQTSGCTPTDFEVLFDELHAKHPDAHLLYLAYSSVTTCSFQSAQIAVEGREYVTAIDTKQVSVGQGMIVVEVAKLLKANPDMTLDEAVAAANEIIGRANMCFLPDNLEFLRAGGRVSNVVALVGGLLGIKPCIEILDGKLMATKKFRGKMEKVAVQMIREYADKYALDRKELWFVYTVGLSDEVRRAAEQAARDAGFAAVQWIRANGVITTHGGPAAFGMAGFTPRSAG